MSVARTRIDPVTTAVIGGALDSIAVEMGHKLARMSYSSIIRESEDFGCAICDHEARQLCESSQSTPLQSGPIPGYVRGINRRFAELGEEWRPGDVVIHNHAYYGASHGPDVAFVVPVFHDGELVAFSATTAHHLDLGALTPGTCGIVDATDAYAEGLQFNAIKIEEEGRRNEWIWRILRDNIRAAQLVVGDMEAQLAACRIGAQRFVDLLERYGLDTVRAASEDLMDYSERMLRREIEKLPDGTLHGRGHPRRIPRPSRSVVPRPRGSGRHHGRRLGSDRRSHRDVAAGRSADQHAVRGNRGHRGTPDRSLDPARHGASRAGADELRALPADPDHSPRRNTRESPLPGPGDRTLLLGERRRRYGDAGARAGRPGRVSAGIGHLKVTAFSGLRGGTHWVYMDIMEGSYGGRRGKDGLDAVDTLYANTRNNPIEDIESHYPLRLTRYELTEETGGRGRWRGGLGSIREFEFTEPGGFSIEGDGSKHAPPGLFGGLEGTPGSIVLNPDTDREQVLPSKLPYRKAAAGDRLRLVGPSGGGYGDPADRDPAAIHDDVLDGYAKE